MTPETPLRYFAFVRGPGAIGELDGLRALAILLVLARHAVRPFFSIATPLLPLGGWDAAIPLINGWMGVDLFFVLSGFLIATQICNRYGGIVDRVSFGDYMKRRILCIIPTYYFMLFIAAMGLIPLYHVAGDYLGFRVVYHMLFLQDYLPSNIIVAFWSLGVEEKFYILAPFVLAAVFRIRQPGAQYMLLGALALLPMGLRALTALRHPEITAYVPYFQTFRSPFHLSFDGLVVGSLCALIYRDRMRLAWTGNSALAHMIFWVGAGLALWLSAFSVQLAHIGLFQKIPLQSLLALAMGGMLLGLVLGGGPRAFFRAGWMLVVARLSYALYLVHLTVLPEAEHLMKLMTDGAAYSPGQQFLIFAPIFMALSFAAALLLHYGVEKPFLLLKDQLPARHLRAIA